MAEQDVPPKSRFVSGLALGVGVTTLVLGLASTLYVSSAGRKARAGWNLRPIVVAAQDLPAGTVLTWEHLSQRSAPEQFVTPSIYMPDEASELIQQRLLAPVRAGDPLVRGLLWRGSVQDLAACQAKNTPPPADAAPPGEGEPPAVK